MLETGKIMDMHMHIGNKNFFKNIIENSQHRGRYRMYDEIKYEQLNFSHHVKNIYGGIVMPMLAKELTIPEMNRMVSDFKSENPYLHKCFLIDQENPTCVGYEGIKLFKEHFLIHKFEDYEKRKKSYEYINSVGGAIIVHSKDNIRSESIKRILEDYSNIKIIIAHLGRNTYSDNDFIKNILSEFKDNYAVYIDTSTVIDPKVITLACQVFDVNRILFGTDIPFAQTPGYFKKAVSSITNADIPIDMQEKIFYKNAQELLLNMKLNKILR